MSRLEKLLGYLADRLSERSTWEAIAFFVTASTGHSYNLEPGECAILGGLASGLIKAVLPDATPPKE